MHPFHAFHRRFHRGGHPSDAGHGRGDGHHGPHHRDGAHRRGRGDGDRSDLGRFFAHGDLRLVVLHLIAERPRHGYEIIKAIEERVRGAYSPSPGVIYPTLTLLEEMGHSTVTPGEGTKKLHSITPEGRAVLDANRPSVDALLARMARAAEAFGDGPHPAVVRAKEGLKLALRMRLARGPLSEDQNLAVAAALDAATAAIERS